jgi:hypothetical protein
MPSLPTPIYDLLNSPPHYVEIVLFFFVLADVYLMSTTFQEMAVPHLQVSYAQDLFSGAFRTILEFGFQPDLRY